MKTLNLSLHAFKNPLVLSSILVLLVNDHILKVLAPSWLTGKLSDFAGLFFFPFLLTALLALPLETLRLSPRRVMAVACLVTLIWFGAIKIIPPVNLATETLVSWLLGVPIQIVLDPTDLIALPMIGLAWLLWVKLDEKPPQRKMGWLPYVVLGVAMLGTLASDCVLPSYVQNLTIWNDKLYSAYGDSWISFRTASDVVIISADGGRSWQKVDKPPLRVVEDLVSEHQMPTVVCSSENRMLCYRITGQEAIEETHDGGVTWIVAWEPWEDRLDFQQRILSGQLVCGVGRLWNQPTDLTVLETSEGMNVIASMKYNGVLVRDSDGRWTPYSVLKAQPIPTTKTSQQEAVEFVQPEMMIFGFLSLLVLISFNCLTQAVVEGQKSLKFELSQFSMWLGVAFPIIWFVIARLDRASVEANNGMGSLVGIGSILQAGQFSPMIWFIMTLAPVFILIHWRGQWPSQTRTWEAWGTELVGLVIAIVISFLPSYMFVLWALGSIVRYQDAWLLAWGAAIVLVLAGGFYVVWRTRAAVRRKQTPEAD